MQSKVISSEKDWLDLRMKVITATEGACLLGLNKYSSANQMWKNKQENNFTGNAYTLVGQVLEPAVVDITNRILNKDFRLYEEEYRGKVFFYDAALGVGATPDAFEQNILLECKTTRPFSFLRYRGVPPSHYIMQVQIQMLCTGAEEGYLSILSTDLTQSTDNIKWPIVIYKIHKSEKLLEMFLKELERFWTCVKDKKMFRVDSKIKAKARLLLPLVCEEVSYK